MGREQLIHMSHVKYCAVDVDPQRNRLYISVPRTPREIPEASQVLEDFHELKHSLSPGFTMLVDSREEEAGFQRDLALMHDVIDLLFEGGISKLAEVRLHPQMVSMPQKKSPKRIEREVLQKVFTSREEAEDWLDASLNTC